MHTVQYSNNTAQITLHTAFQFGVDCTAEQNYFLLCKSEHMISKLNVFWDDTWWV